MPGSDNASVEKTHATRRKFCWRSADSPKIPGFDVWTNPSEKYYIVKLGSFSQIFGLRIQNLWNHHLDTVDRRTATPWRFNSSPLKIYRDPKGKDFPSNHHSSGAISLNFGGVVIFCSPTDHFLEWSAVSSFLDRMKTNSQTVSCPSSMGPCCMVPYGSFHMSETSTVAKRR